MPYSWSSHKRHAKSWTWDGMGMCMQENIGCLDLTLSPEDMNTLSGLTEQARYIDGQMFLSEEGPWRTYEDLWDESPNV